MRLSNSSPSHIILITLFLGFIAYFDLCFAVNEELKNMCNGLPLFLEGKVCKGFGRGSKELGCPTANFDENVEKLLPSEVLSGVYFGWAQVEKGPVYKMVMSIGWNPFFKNEKRSIETHILHEFSQDFYDSNLKVVVLDYIRPERNFSSIDDLMKEINNDIAIGDDKLNEPKYQIYQNHDFFFKSKDHFQLCKE